MPKGRAPKKVDKEKRKRVQKKAQESRQRLVNKFREDTRDKFFKGNENISDDRLDRRRQQDLAEQRFIRTRMKPVGNTEGTLLQKRDPKGIDLAEFRRRNAMQYGPTLSEIGSDIGYGLSSVAKGFAEKGTPMIQLFKGLSDKFKGGVEAAWDAVRGEPTTAQGTAFPQPGSDTKDFFSSIDTGISTIDPDNMLVQIAKANEGRFDDFPTFQEQLNKATVENFNIPSIGDIVQTASDYADAYQSGVNLDTPVGNININPASQGISLGNYIPTGDMTGISYGGFFKPEDNSYNVGIGTQLPYDIGLSAGVSSNDAPGVALSKYVPLNIPGSGGAIPFVNFSPEGSSLGFNASFDPVRAIYPNASIGLPLNIGASVSDQGKIDPRISFNVPFNSSGLGYMFK